MKLQKHGIAPILKKDCTTTVVILWFKKPQSSKTHIPRTSISIITYKKSYTIHRVILGNNSSRRSLYWYSFSFGLGASDLEFVEDTIVEDVKVGGGGGGGGAEGSRVFGSSGSSFSILLFIITLFSLYLYSARDYFHHYHPVNNHLSE